MKRIMTICAVLLLAMAVLAACGPQEVKKPPDEVTVQLAWTHEALFAGFYAADQQGYYAAEGLEVTLLPRPGPGADTIAVVMDGTAAFGVDYGAGLVISRSQDQPTTAIATIYRRHPLAFITLAGSGITRPHDFPGHTIRTLVPGSSAVAFEAMMARLGLDSDSVEQVDVGFDLSPFFAGELDIWPAFMNSTVLTAREQGYQVNLILPEDYGVHLYGYTLFTTEQLIRENPDLVLRFLRATLQGWQWAVENPEEAGPLALKYDPELDAAHQVAVMEASVPLIHTGEDQIGWMRAEVWEGMHDILLEQGLLDEPLDVDEVYTMEFLQKVYGRE
jgi:NitT/TauT family transport system substrate-binding protein